MGALGGIESKNRSVMPSAFRKESRHQTETSMLTLYDYLPSQNAWKVRQILKHRGLPYSTRIVSIFEGAGQTDAYLRINPWGAVPAVEFDDGRVLSESSAILFHLARGSDYLPDDPFVQAKVLQWLSFEGDYVQATVGSLRYWILTGKIGGRSPEVIDGRRQQAARALGILDLELGRRPFLAGERYSIADIAVFAYGAHAEEADISLTSYPNFQNWIDRVKAQPGFLEERYLYDIDPHSGRELS